MAYHEEYNEKYGSEYDNYDRIHKKEKFDEIIEIFYK